MFLGFDENFVILTDENYNGYIKHDSKIMEYCIKIQTWINYNIPNSKHEDTMPPHHFDERPPSDQKYSGRLHWCSTE